MTDVAYDLLEKMVELFYAGEVYVTNQQLPSMKAVLESMRVPDLNIFAEATVFDRLKAHGNISLTKVISTPAPSARVMMAPKPAGPQNPAKRARSDVISQPMALQPAATMAKAKTPSTIVRAMASKPKVPPTNSPSTPPNWHPLQTASVVVNKLPAALQKLGGCTLTVAGPKKQPVADIGASEAVAAGPGNAGDSVNGESGARNTPNVASNRPSTPLNASAPGPITPAMLLSANVSRTMRLFWYFGAQIGCAHFGSVARKAGNRNEFGGMHMLRLRSPIMFPPNTQCFLHRLRTTRHRQWRRLRCGRHWW